MNGSGTGKIMEAQLAQPAAAPDPVTGNGIQEQRNTGRIDTVCRELGALCHRTGNNGCRGRAEHGLENRERPKGYARGKDMAVISHDQGIQLAKNGTARTKHDTEANQPETGGADAEVHQVFHQNIAGIFCSRKSRFTHCKASLHKEDQCGSQQNPNGIDR